MILEQTRRWNGSYDTISLGAILQTVAAVIEIVLHHIPMSADDGHKMLDDFGKETFQEYSCLGRMRRLAKLRGIETGIRQNLGLS